MKTQEIIFTANNNNNPHEPILSLEASESQENWGRRFLTHLEQTQPFGLNVEIVADTNFQQPSDQLNIDYVKKHLGHSTATNGCPVFGFMLFRVNNTETSFHYSWSTRRTELHGPGRNSPFADHNGTYLILSFEHPRPEEGNARRYRHLKETNGRYWDEEHRGYSEHRRRPFYASHVCFKIKEKHTYYGDDSELNLSDNSYSPYNMVYAPSTYDDSHNVGTSKVDIYATTPLGYDNNNNAQRELIDKYGSPLGLEGGRWGYMGYSYNRRTFIRWSAYTDTTKTANPAKLKWRFSGRYYSGNSKTAINNGNMPNLESFEITKDEAFLGKGKIYADKDKVLYCPLTGFPLRSCSSIANDYKKIENYQSSRADWY